MSRKFTPWKKKELIYRAARAAIAVGKQVLLEDGRITTTSEKYAVRKSACDECPHWSRSAYFGVGGCRQCGCSKLKLMLETERCPIGRW